LWWKTAESRHLGELLLRISRIQCDLVDTLDAGAADLSGKPYVAQQLLRLLPQIAARQASLDRRLRETEGVLLDLQSWKAAVAPLPDGPAGFGAAASADLRKRLNEVSDQAATLSQELALLGVGNSEIVDRLVRDLAEVHVQVSGVRDQTAALSQRLAVLERSNGEIPDRVARDLAGVQSQVSRQLEGFEEQIATSGKRLADLEIGNCEIPDRVARDLAGVQSQISRQLEGFEERIASTGRRLADLGLQNQRIRTDISLQDRRLTMFLTEARKRLPNPFNEEQIQALTARGRDILDSFYMAFEEVYRGSRGEIKERQSLYLPVLRAAGFGTARLAALDLGCGRGEWIELLAQEGWEALGVDSNESMLERCRQLGLKVERGDALEFLQSAGDATLGALTAFHVVEHLPFERLLVLIDEALRTLRPGGVFILETPNPDNLLVGASTFYLDPTHIRPIPSGALRFAVEARGFCNVEVWNLQPLPESARLPEGADGVAARLNELLCGPRDYAVIGRHP
jgi:O-antigen chain-terminating methyltransferase